MTRFAASAPVLRSEIKKKDKGMAIFAIQRQCYVGCSSGFYDYWANDVEHDPDFVTATLEEVVAHVALLNQRLRDKEVRDLNQKIDDLNASIASYKKNQKVYDDMTPEQRALFSNSHVNSIPPYTGMIANEERKIEIYKDQINLIENSDTAKAHDFIGACYHCYEVVMSRLEDVV